jgi:hypothetical protein
MDDAYLEQINFLKTLVETGYKQVSDLENIGRIEGETNFAIAQLYVFKVNNLKVFWDRVNFLCEKLSSESEEKFHFYLPILRVPLEVYGRLLWLNFQDIVTQCGYAVGIQLFAIAQQYKFLIQAPEIKESYTKQHLLLKPYLDSRFDIPSDINLFSKNKLAALGLNISNESIFSKSYLNQSSAITSKFFRIKQEDFYNRHYRIWSNFVHGDVIHSTRNIKLEIKEKFWILAECQVFSCLMIELTNQKMIKNKRASEFKIWTDLFIPSKRKFSELWKESRKEL